MTRTFLAAFIVGLALAAPAPTLAQSAAPAAAALSPADEASARALVSSLITELQAAAQTGGDQAAREARLRAIVGQRLDTPRIARFLLGANRAKATPAELARYDALAPRYMAGEFSARIDELVAQRVTIDSVQARGANEALVRSTFPRKRDGARVRIDWRLTRAGPGAEWRLFDVYLNGVSRLVIRRDEFNAIVARQGMAGLLAHLEKQAS
ncbi:MAG: phospholipid-binding protein MlaC [Sphingomonadaceae bacterium]